MRIESAEDRRVSAGRSLSREAYDQCVSSNLNRVIYLNFHARPLLIGLVPHSQDFLYTKTPKILLAEKWRPSTEDEHPCALEKGQLVKLSCLVPSARLPFSPIVFDVHGIRC